jgi:hypothetical protein
MRLTWKLALLIAIGVGAQLLINRHANDIDEAAFAFRVFVAHLNGKTAADPDTMDMANALWRRQMLRAGLTPIDTPTAAVDFEDEIGRALAVRVNASGAAN